MRANFCVGSRRGVVGVCVDWEAQRMLDIRLPILRCSLSVLGETGDSQQDLLGDGICSAIRASRSLATSRSSAHQHSESSHCLALSACAGRPSLNFNLDFCSLLARCS